MADATCGYEILDLLFKSWVGGRCVVWVGMFWIWFGEVFMGAGNGKR